MASSRKLGSCLANGAGSIRLGHGVHLAFNGSGGSLAPLDSLSDGAFAVQIGAKKAGSAKNTVKTSFGWVAEWSKAAVLKTRRRNHQTQENTAKTGVVAFSATP